MALLFSRITILFVFSFITIGAFAIEIKGKVLDDESRSPIGDANIYLFKDSKQISNSISDQTGFFTFEFESEGNYTLKVYRSGYRNKTIVIPFKLREDGRYPPLDIYIERQGLVMEGKLLSTMNSLPIKGHKVNLKDLGSGMESVVNTDDKGDYNFILEPDKEYELYVISGDLKSFFVVSTQGVTDPVTVYRDLRIAIMGKESNPDDKNSKRFAELEQREEDIAKKIAKLNELEAQIEDKMKRLERAEAKIIENEKRFESLMVRIEREEKKLEELESKKVNEIRKLTSIKFEEEEKDREAKEKVEKGGNIIIVPANESARIKAELQRQNAKEEVKRERSNDKPKKEKKEVKEFSEKDVAFLEKQSKKAIKKKKKEDLKAEMDRMKREARLLRVQNAVLNAKKEVNVEEKKFDPSPAEKNKNKKADVVIRTEKPEDIQKSKDKGEKDLTIAKEQPVTSMEPDKPKEFDVLNPVKKGNIGTIYYNTGKALLRKSNVTFLEGFLTTLKEDPEKKLSMKVYSDANIEKTIEEYICNLRAESLIQYFMANGVPFEQLEVRIYGYQELANECGVGVECPDEKHAENRRVVFVLN